MKKLKVAFVKDVMDQWHREEISFSKMVELLNEELNIDLHEIFMRHYNLSEDEIDVEVWNTITRLTIALKGEAAA